MPSEADPGSKPIAHRGMISGCIILAVVMQALDTTIANVALPYMQGSVAASADQINWVLTSYIVASAILTPPSGYLSLRFGRKRMLMISIAGFVLASVLCGAAQTLTQIVCFRLLQGALGAFMGPITQSILLDIYAVHERGRAMAMFGMAIMVGPILGPVVGGWITDHVSWRWVFYINVPIGIAALVGISAYVSETRREASAKLDWLGFISLSLAIGALQMLLDRGEQLNWFSSPEIVIETILSVSAFYVFLVHTLTGEHPFVDPKLFRDRNFVAGTIFIFIIGMILLASLSLMSPFLQTLMGYPVVTAGLVMGPRGVGTLLCMVVVGRVIGKLDTRWLLFAGLAVTAWALYGMSRWSPDVSEYDIVTVGFVQGVGLGLLFVPLTTIAFATLPAEQRTEASGFYNLSRNIGSSVGISICSAMLTSNVQINHAEIGAHITQFNAALSEPGILALLDPTSLAGRARLDGLITQQASIISYMNDYRMLMLLALASIPLLFMLHNPPQLRAPRSKAG